MVEPSSKRCKTTKQAQVAPDVTDITYGPFVVYNWNVRHRKTDCLESVMETAEPVFWCFTSGNAPPIRSAGSDILLCLDYHPVRYGTCLRASFDAKEVASRRFEPTPHRHVFKSDQYVCVDVASFTDDLMRCLLLWAPKTIGSLVCDYALASSVWVPTCPKLFSQANWGQSDSQLPLRMLTCKQIRMRRLARDLTRDNGVLVELLLTIGERIADDLHLPFEAFWHAYLALPFLPSQECCWYEFVTTNITRLAETMKQMNTYALIRFAKYIVNFMAESLDFTVAKCDCDLAKTEQTLRCLSPSN